MGTNWSAARAEVALEALHVSPETTIATLCPVCHGGASGEKKLSVTRTHNGALYVCFRAACSFRGFVAIGEQGSKDVQRKPRPARPLTQGTAFDTVAASIFLIQYVGFPEVTLEELRPYLAWIGEDRVYRCRGFHGENLGHVVRSPDKTIRTFRAKEGSEMYFVARPRKFSPVYVLVEDPVSALCVAFHGYTAVALLGTSVPDTVDAYLRVHAEEIQILVWLDPDAETKSLEIANRYLGAKAVIGYPKDPKDLPNLGEILQMYR
jgi:hypothetical protein